jgi:hypothetical protein
MTAMGKFPPGIMPDIREIGSMINITSKGPGENSRAAASNEASSIIRT